jgi:hypothetical protein
MVLPVFESLLVSASKIITSGLRLFLFLFEAFDLTPNVPELKMNFIYSSVSLAINR